jgi:hypothetical protein
LQNGFNRAELPLPNRMQPPLVSAPRGAAVPELVS